MGTLADVLQSLFAKGKTSEDAIAEVMAPFGYLPVLPELYKRAYIDALILCECERRMPRADMVQRIARKRNAGKSSGELERVIRGKRTAINQLAQPEYESMTTGAIAARHAWLMEDD